MCLSQSAQLPLAWRVLGQQHPGTSQEGKGQRGGVKLLMRLRPQIQMSGVQSEHVCLYMHIYIWGFAL